MSKTYITSIRLPVEYREKLKKEMESKDRSANWIVKEALDQYLEHPKKPAKQAKRAAKTVQVISIPDYIDGGIPDYIDGDLWIDFIEMRKSLKAPATERAHKLLLDKLTQMRARGFDPNEAIKASIENGWKGVFEPRKRTNRAHELGDF